MINIGITGQTGFIGRNLSDFILKYPEKYRLVPFKKDFFSNDDCLSIFVKECDVLIHLAAVMRSSEGGYVYNTNMDLTKKLISALNNCTTPPHLFFSSSIQDVLDNEYGRSKRDSASLFMEWSVLSNANFTCLRFPNIFGPNARPYSTSFIATFCYELTHGIKPNIIQDKHIPLLYIDRVIETIFHTIDRAVNGKSVGEINFNPDVIMKVSDVLSLLSSFMHINDSKEIALLDNKFKSDLLFTLKSYENYKL